VVKAIINKEKNVGKSNSKSTNALVEMISKYLQLPLQWYIERLDDKIGFILIQHVQVVEYVKVYVLQKKLE
jgi:hypothetical protein